MKELQLLILLGMFMGSYQLGRSQVFGHPGATWVFSSPSMAGVCFEYYEKWEYLQDTAIYGINVKDFLVTSKVILPPPFPNSQVSYSYHYFNVSGDTVRLFLSSDTTWQEIYNFSVVIGDTVLNPLGNKLNGWANSCSDSLPYSGSALVTNVGTTVIDGQSLRFYTVHYATGSPWGPDSAYQTFYERIITQNYWYPNDNYWCGAVPECGSPGLNCYKDSGMTTDSLCNDLTWFNYLSIEDEAETTESEIIVYPNPVHQTLLLKSNIETLLYYQIISLDGKLIMNHVQSPVDVSHLSNGIYFITNENRTWYKKFIKQ